MDPVATLRSIYDSLEDGNGDEALESCDYLLNWLRGGGFIPGALDPNRVGAIRQVQALRRQACLLTK